MKKVFLLFLIVNLVNSGVKANISDLLNGIDTIYVLKNIDPPRIIEGDDLFTLIDGGAEIYMEYGFVRVADVSYEMGPNNKLAVQIYEMRDDTAAFGIFSFTRNPGDSSLNIGDYAVGNEYYVMAQKNKYFIIVSSQLPTKESAELTKKIASTIASNIQGNGTLPGLVLKSQLAGFSIEQVKFIAGKIALTGKYFFSHKNIFNTNNSVCIQDGALKAFIFEYPDSLAAIGQLKIVNEELLSTGRFSGFKTERNRFECTDRNLKPLNILCYNKYIIVIAGTDEDNKILNRIYNNY
jgi:hypothetical protein